jgi:hypothetical protein
LDFLTASAERLRHVEPNHRALLVPHPDRRTVEDEYQFIKGEIEKGNPYLHVRYATEKMTEQMAYFANAGMDVQAALYCGTIWMIENTDIFQRCWDSWWDQNLRFGMMDQLSLPLMLSQFRLTPQSLAINLWDNKHFRYVSHQKLM